MKKLWYIVPSIFIGIIGTILVIKFIPTNINSINETRNVSITENNTIKEAINEVYNSVVLIENYKRNIKAGTGTGFVYKKDDKLGYIITNYHVINGAESVKVKYIDDKAVDAKVLGGDEYSDLAILSVDADSVLQVAKLGNSVDLELGDTLFTVGSPLGDEYMGTVTKGILSGKNRTVKVNLTNESYMMEVLQTDAAINPGNSGGPLVNIKGEVIGVNSMKLVQNQIEGMGFAIPIDIAKAYIERLEKGEKIKRPLLGVEMTDLTNQYLIMDNQISIDKKLTSGAVIINVLDKSPAKEAELQRGDVIIEVDGTKVTDSAHFKYLLYKFEVGDNMKVKYNRNGKVNEATIKLNKGLDD